MLDLTEDPNVVLKDYDEAKKIAELLHKHYPGHLWGVTVESENGIATVRNLYLSGNWGFILKLKDIQSYPQLKKRVIWAGGELLERFNLSRKRFNEDEYFSLPTDFAGQIIAEKG